MEFLNEFGLNLPLLIAQIVNFVIVLWVFKKFLYKPIQSTLENRQKAIKEGLKQAEESRLILSKAEDRQKAILKEAQEESKKLLDETRKQSSEIISQAEASAKTQTQRILMDAKKQIELESKEAQMKLAMQTNDLVVEFLQKSASQLFGEDDQKKVIKNAVDKIKKRAD